MERFWEKVKKSEGCWEWIAAKNALGYGKFADWPNGWKLAHRVAYELCVAEIPENMSVCHACDNASCVNPDHLFLGTHAENMEDMADKGRARKSSGDLNPNRKLDWDAVRHIRASGSPDDVLAKMYGVRPSTIYGVRRGYSWKCP